MTGRSGLAIAALAGWLCAASGCSPDVTPRPPRGAALELPTDQLDQLTVLSYNTHGLAAWVAGDDPERRFPRIGALSNRYDLTLLQEDFEHHERLRTETRQPLIRRGNPSRFDWCPFCAGSGLTLLSRLDPAKLLELANLSYDACAGWLLGANDCLATKGFQLARVLHPAGPEIFVVNTHLDAGIGPDDRAARRRQLDLLSDELSRRADGAPLILAGDLNLDASQPEDAVLLEGFKSGLSLRDSGARADAGSGFVVLDYILFRGGDRWQLEVLEAGQDPAFFADGEHLSDHPALFTRFRISPAR